MNGAGRIVSIRKAGKEDLPLIHDMADVVFRHTYKDILSPEQMEYMMEWMYSLPNLERQLLEGHTYYIASIGGVPAFSLAAFFKPFYWGFLALGAAKGYGFLLEWW